MELSKKLALVTGSSRGIGFEIAQSLGAIGYRVILNNTGENNVELESALKLLREKKVDASAYAFDVGNRKAVDAAFADINNAIGGVDVLVNNAGIVRDKTLLKMDGQDWDSVINTNLTGVFNCSKAALPGMIEKGWGRIINVSSIVGQYGAFGQCNYAASKAGIIGFTKSLAREVSKRGVTVNAIAPGYIDTSMTAAIPANIKEKIIEEIPARRFGSASNIAELVLYLAQDNASYMSGAVLNVDGGY